MNALQSDLSATCWSYPEQTIHFLEKGSINVELTNLSESRIKIEKIFVKFKTEDEFKDYELKYLGSQFFIEPKKISPRIEIPFKAELTLIEGTNTYHLVVCYKKNNINSSINTIPTFQYLILKPTRPQVGRFFISHKDPKDTPIAKLLDRYLQKIGFKGFLAEIEKRPGTNVWKNKIFPAIDISTALIVVWTSNAKKNSKNILKEMKYAKKKKKKIILLGQHKVNLPKTFPKYTEFVTISKEKLHNDLVNAVEHIAETYRSGLYSEDVI